MPFLSSTVLKTKGLEGALLKAAMPQLLRAAQTTGEHAINYITDNASSRFKGGYRSRGGISLSSRAPYSFTIVRNRDGPKITFRVRGNAQFMAKFHSQNGGSGEHPIGPRLKRALAFEGRNQVFRGSREARKALGTHPVKGVVVHPGTPATHFYEDGIERAVREFPGLLS